MSRLSENWRKQNSSEMEVAVHIHCVLYRVSPKEVIFEMYWNGEGEQAERGATWDKILDSLLSEMAFYVILIIHIIPKQSKRLKSHDTIVYCIFNKTGFSFRFSSILAS